MTCRKTKDAHLLFDAPLRTSIYFIASRLQRYVVVDQTRLAEVQPLFLFFQLVDQRLYVPKKNGNLRENGDNVN